MSFFVCIIVASTLGQFCSRLRYQAMGIENNVIKPCKNGLWLSTSGTEQKISKFRFISDRIFAFYIIKIFHWPKSCILKFHGVILRWNFSLQIQSSRSSRGRENSLLDKIVQKWTQLWRSDFELTRTRRSVCQIGLNIGWSMFDVTHPNFE